MGPLIPRPWVTALACVLTAGMFWNIWLDSSSVDYSGGQATIVIAVLIAGILGFDLGAWSFIRGRRDRDDNGSAP